MLADFDKTKKFILEYKENQTLLAAVIGIKISAFSDKMKGVKYSKFSPEQQKTIINYRSSCYYCRSS